MKTAAKVFIILGMIFGFWYILPIIFGAIALKKLKNAKCKADISVATCVLTLIFCSVLGGIFLLCLNDGHFPAEETPVVEEIPEEGDVNNKL
ncbi:MAG: hypothetical protein J6B77_07820 [Clostridia bacterium]|nr:hypothetical protein [Clostridia bacterium]